MNIHVKVAVMAIAFHALIVAVPSLLDACKVPRGYSAPTNYEVVKGAEVIVLARAARISDVTDGIGMVVFQTEEVLKGHIGDDEISVQGHLDYAGAGDEGDFLHARPGAYRGSCVAMDFRLGHLFLLFLDRDEGGWWISGPAFTRVSEEVSSSGSPWVLAVRTYLRIASLQDYEAEKSALARLAALDGMQLDDSYLPSALVEDAGRHLIMPSSHKSISDLAQMLGTAVTDSEREQILWAIAWKDSDEAQRFLESVVAQPGGEIHRPKLDQQAVRVLNRLLDEYEPCSESIVLDEVDAPSAADSDN
jgi:hypothetical protein